MPLIALKCPECNGDIQLDDAREFGFCMYCGCKVLLERPAPRAGRKPNLRSILVLASESIASRDWKSAKSKVEKALMADIDCPDAWYMKALIYGADGDEVGERRAEARGRSLEGRSLGVMTYEDYSKLARKKVTFTLECGYTRLGSGAVLVIDDKSHQLGSRITVKLFPGEHKIYAYDETRGGSVRSSATGKFVVKSDCDFVVRSDARGLSVRRSARWTAGIPRESC